MGTERMNQPDHGPSPAAERMRRHRERRRDGLRCLTIELRETEWTFSSERECSSRMRATTGMLSSTRCTGISRKPNSKNARARRRCDVLRTLIIGACPPASNGAPYLLRGEHYLCVAFAVRSCSRSITSARYWRRSNPGGSGSRRRRTCVNLTSA